MSDPPGVTSVLGIESVEWLAGGGDNLTVRVTGRWRRRPTWSGQPTLVIEAPGRRYRFPAIAEPPSLTGTGPGMWRISFALPAALAPDLGGRAWLQFGSIIVPLPSAVRSLDPIGGHERSAQLPQSAGSEPSQPSPPSSVSPPSTTPPPPPQSVTSEPVPAAPVEPVAAAPVEPVAAASVEPVAAASVEPVAAASVEPVAAAPVVPEPVAAALSPVPPAAGERADRQIADLTQRVESLERQLTEARAEAEQLAGAVGTQQLTRRAAEQRAHVERALREDLHRQLSERTHETARAREAMGLLAEVEARVRELERELADARRRIDEAEQVAASATAARERAERRTHGVEARVADADARAADAVARAADAVARAADADARTAAVEARAAEAVTSGSPDRSQIAERRRLDLEQDLIARRASAPRIPTEPASAVIAPESAATAPAARRGATGFSIPDAAVPDPADSDATAAGHDALVSGLRRELALRSGTEAGLRSRVIEAEARLAARDALDQRTRGVLDQLGRELTGLRAALDREQAARRAAERRVAELEGELGGARTRSHEAATAIAELRETLETLRHPRPEAEPAAAESPAVEAERFSEALVRLRENIAPQATDAASATGTSASVEAEQAELIDPLAPPQPDDPDPARPADLDLPTVGRRWLAPAIKALTRADPDRAGRLIVDLLPAQGAVFAQSIAYDLVLGGDRGCARMTVREGAAEIVVTDAPRAPGDVDFAVTGDPAALARLLAAGRLRRRFGRRVASVQGRRDGLAALDALLGTDLGLNALHRSGVRLQARTALSLIAHLVTPAWTQHERFTFAYESDGAPTAYLLVRNGQALEVTETPPEGRIATTVSGPEGSLELVLLDRPGTAATVTGDLQPVTLLRGWVKLAQSG